jgi:hypothetical protein
VARGRVQFRFGMVVAWEGGGVRKSHGWRGCRMFGVRGFSAASLWPLFDSFFLYFCQINQLEKDKDVISQSQAISALEKLPQLSFAVINALNNFLNDTKVF